MSKVKELLEEVTIKEETRESNLPVPLSSFNKDCQIATGIRNQILKTETPSRHIKIKDGFPYVESTYVDNLFQSFFPVNKVSILSSGVFQNYYIHFDVEIKAFLSPDISITKVGTGAARIQVKSGAKKDHIDTGKTITPFDYVDFGNSRKSALTLAIKNAQERFGIAADVTGRIILSDEDLERINEAYKEMYDLLENPRDRNKIREKWLSAKSPNEKLKILENLRELTL